MLTFTNVAGREALSGDWTIVMSQTNGGNPEINHDHPYYKQNDGDLYMWWMWHPEQGDGIGHWVINDTPGDLVHFLISRESIYTCTNTHTFQLRQVLDME